MKGWIEWKLGDVCEFEGGSQPPKSVFSRTPKENYIRLIQIRDYKSDKNIVYIPQKQAKRFCDENDIMIGRYGPPVFQILKGLKGAYNVALMKAIPNEELLNRDFLFTFLKYSKIQEYIIGLSERAAGQSGVNKKALNDYPILLPTLPEQQFIVSILDEAFAAIAKAKANTEKNLQNAKELFESYLQSVFANPGEDWEEKTLGEVCVFKGGGTPSTKEKKYWEGDIPWVSPKDMKSEMISNSQDHVSKEAIQNSATSLIPKDSILIVVRSGILARIVPIGITERELTINQDLKALCPDKNVNLDFLYYFLKGNMKFLLSKVTRGATVHRLTTDSLRDLSIKIPSLIDQRSIVKKLSGLSTEAKKLEALYQQKLDDLKELKKSILQKAFSGELKTNQDVLV